MNDTDRTCQAMSLCANALGRHDRRCPAAQPADVDEQRAARVQADLERAMNRIKERHHNRALGDC